MGDKNPLANRDKPHEPPTLEDIKKALATEDDRQIEGIKWALTTLGVTTIDEVFRTEKDNNGLTVLRLKTFDEMSIETKFAIKTMHISYDKSGRQIVKVEMYDRLRAFDMLAKFLGMYQQDGTGTGPSFTGITITPPSETVVENSEEGGQDGQRREEGAGQQA